MIHKLYDSGSEVDDETTRVGGTSGESMTEMGRAGKVYTPQ